MKMNWVMEAVVKATIRFFCSITVLGNIFFFFLQLQNYITKKKHFLNEMNLNGMLMSHINFIERSISYFLNYYILSPSLLRN